MNKVPFIIAQVVIFLAIWVWFELGVLWLALAIAVWDIVAILVVGSGSRKAVPTPSTAVPCRGCEGKGKVKCLACKGGTDGLLNFYGCPRCGGEGGFECVACKGTGEGLGA